MHLLDAAGQSEGFASQCDMYFYNSYFADGGM